MNVVKINKGDIYYIIENHNGFVGFTVKGYAENPPKIQSGGGFIELEAVFLEKQEADKQALEFKNASVKAEIADKDFEVVEVLAATPGRYTKGWIPCYMWKSLYDTIIQIPIDDWRKAKREYKKKVKDELTRNGIIKPDFYNDYSAYAWNKFQEFYIPYIKDLMEEVAEEYNLMIDRGEIISQGFKGEIYLNFETVDGFEYDPINNDALSLEVEEVFGYPVNDIYYDGPCVQVSIKITQWSSLMDKYKLEKDTADQQYDSAIQNILDTTEPYITDAHARDQIKAAVGKEIRTGKPCTTYR